MKKNEIPEALRDTIEQQLMAGEELLWAGQPDPMRMARRKLLQAGFGVIWLVFVIFIFGDFWTMPSRGPNVGGFGSIFSLMPLFFIGVGSWTVSTPLRDYFTAKRTIYAVTDQRALIISGLFSQSAKSYGRHQIEFVDTRVHSNGTGDIIFDRGMQARNRSIISFGSNRSTYTMDVGFFGIDYPRQVEALMLQQFIQGDAEVTEKAKHG
ncbi:MAG: hypothetical protein K8L99_26325 [Anaerolineae bacterium]|nr:hypothetical protein [Anaerolineae bacterium]